MKHELRSVSGKEFHDTINHEMRNNPYNCFLTNYSIEEYEDMDHRIILDSQAGFAINSGDVVSMFNSRSNPKRGVVDVMMPRAVALGGGDLRLLRRFTC